MVEASRVLKAMSPGIIIFATTIAISIITKHPPGLFDAGSTRSLITRSLLISIILISVVPLAPRIVSAITFVMKDKTPIGQLVKVE